MLYVVVEMKTGTYWVGAGRVLGGAWRGFSGTMKMFSILIWVVAEQIHILTKTPQTTHLKCTFLCANNLSKRYWKVKVHWSILWFVCFLGVLQNTRPFPKTHYFCVNLDRKGCFKKYFHFGAIFPNWKNPKRHTCRPSPSPISPKSSEFWETLSCPQLLLSSRGQSISGGSVGDNL